MHCPLQIVFMRSFYCRLSRWTCDSTIVTKSAAQFGAIATFTNDLPPTCYLGRRSLGSTSPLIDPRLDMTFKVECTRLTYWLTLPSLLCAGTCAGVLQLDSCRKEVYHSKLSCLSVMPFCFFMTQPFVMRSSSPCYPVAPVCSGLQLSSPGFTQIRQANISCSENSWTHRNHVLRSELGHLRSIPLGVSMMALALLDFGTLL